MPMLVANGLRLVYRREDTVQSAAAEKVVPLRSDGDDWYLKVLNNNENVYTRMDVWAACHECPPSWVRCLSPENHTSVNNHHQDTLNLKTRRCRKTLMSYFSDGSVSASSLNFGHWSNRQLTLRIRSFLSPCSRIDSENVSKLCCSVTISCGRNSVPVSAGGINPVLHLTLSRENPHCLSDRQSPPRSLWEKVLPSSWRNHSPPVEASPSNLCQVFFSFFASFGETVCFPFFCQL